MTPKEKKTIEVIENTMDKLKEAFCAINTLEVETRVSLNGWDLEYFNAMELLEGWLKNLKNLKK